MKKTMYILGSIEALVGCVILCATSVLRELIPILGKFAFEAAVIRSYGSDSYQVSFTLAVGIAAALILVGIVQMVVSFFKKN